MTRKREKGRPNQDADRVLVCSAGHRRRAFVPFGDGGPWREAGDKCCAVTFYDRMSGSERCQRRLRWKDEEEGATPAVLSTTAVWDGDPESNEDGYHCTVCGEPSADCSHGRRAR